MKGVWLEDLTWREAKARFDAGAVVVVPIGAASKAHGDHLPLKTDWLTARALGQRLIERLALASASSVVGNRSGIRSPRSVPAIALEPARQGQCD
jgi:creatinine amidohydrolase